MRTSWTSSTIGIVTSRGIGIAKCTGFIETQPTNRHVIIHQISKNSSPYRKIVEHKSRSRPCAYTTQYHMWHIRQHNTTRVGKIFFGSYTIRHVTWHWISSWYWKSKFTMNIKLILNVKNHNEYTIEYQMSKITMNIPSHIECHMWYWNWKWLSTQGLRPRTPTPSAGPDFSHVPRHHTT